METIYDCVVVANGSFPQTAGPLELLKSAPAIIACDGAVQNLHERGLEPTEVDVAADGCGSRQPLSAIWTVFHRKCSGYMPTASIPWKIRR